MKIDEAIQRIEAALSAGASPFHLTQTECAELRRVLEELYQTAVDQGRMQLQEDLRHLLGVVKE